MTIGNDGFPATLHTHFVLRVELLDSAVVVMEQRQKRLHVEQ